MPTCASKFSSDYLLKGQMHTLLLALSEVLKSILGEHALIASYGWGANIHSDLSYIPMREDTRWIQYLIEDSIDQRIVVPGESDFRIATPDGRFEVVFCHESDIHLDGSDEELLQRFMATEPYSQLHWNTRDEVAESMA